MKRDQIHDINGPTSLNVLNVDVYEKCTTVLYVLHTLYVHLNFSKFTYLFRIFCYFNCTSLERIYEILSAIISQPC